MKSKKILALLLVVVLTAGLLSACTPEDTGTLKIGGIAPMSGSLSVYGTSLQRGAQLAAEEINAFGGVQLDIRYEDDVNDPEKSVAAYNTLKEWGMKVFLGSATSVPAIATSPLSCADEIFSFNPTAAAVEVVGGVGSSPRLGNVFQLNLSATGQGNFSANYIKEHALGQKVAVIYQSDNPYSTGALNGFQTAAAAAALNVVSTVPFTTADGDNFSAQLTAAREAGADLIFLPVYYDAAARILTQAKEMGYSPAFFGTDTLNGILSVEGFDPALAEGVTFLSSFNAGAADEASGKFIEAYQAKYGEAPNQFAAAAYDTIHVLYGSLTLAKCNSGMTAAEMNQPLAEFAAGDLILTGLTGDDMAWDETGTVVKESRVAVIRNGAYVGAE